MKLFLFVFSLFIFVSCINNKEFKSEETKKNQKKIPLKITIEPGVKIKK